MVKDVRNERTLKSNTHKNSIQSNYNNDRTERRKLYRASNRFYFYFHSIFSFDFIFLRSVFWSAKADVNWWYHSDNFVLENCFFSVSKRQRNQQGAKLCTKHRATNVANGPSGRTTTAVERSRVRIWNRMIKKTPK